MGIVRFALRFPHTFYVVAALILFLGVVASVEMPTDIFPEINIPVVTVIWSYTGLSTPEMEQRVTTYSQYAISSNVNGIKNIEAQTMAGLSVQKIYFQPDVNLDLAIAQIVAGDQCHPCAVAAGHPGSAGGAVQCIQRAGAADQPEFRHAQRTAALRLRHLSDPPATGADPRHHAADAGGRKVSPDHGRSGSVEAARQGTYAARRRQRRQRAEPDAARGHGQDSATRNMPSAPTRRPRRIDDLNNIPVKVVNGATIFVKDVGQVHDGWLVQQNVVRQNGRRSVLLSIIKNGNASTLSVVNAVHEALKTARAAAPPGHADQRAVRSVGVRQAVGSRRAARRRDRGRPHSTDDPAVPGIVAFDAGGHDLDPAVDPHLAGRAVFPRRDAEYDDARRAGAGGRHSGGRFHRHDREHPSPAYRGRNAAAAGDAARRRRHRDSDAGVDACHQLRLHLGGVPRRAGEISVHAAGARGGVRDAGLLRPVANPDADRHRIAAQGRESWPGGRRCERLVRALSCRLRAPLRDDAARLFTLARRTDQASLHHSIVHAVCCWRSAS